MSKNLFVIAAAFAGLIGAHAAWADTDYPCFNTCVKDGKATPSVCLGQCTKDQPAAAPTATDYRCIDLCKQGGASSYACMSKCTYNPVAPLASESASGAALPTLPKPNDIAVSNHDVLQAPVPVDGIILPPQQKTPVSTSAKNYACIPQCMKDGMQYDLCNQNCEAVTPEMQTKSP